VCSFIDYSALIHYVRTRAQVEYQREKMRENIRQKYGIEKKKEKGKGKAKTKEMAEVMTNEDSLDRK